MKYAIAGGVAFLLLTIGTERLCRLLDLDRIDTFWFGVIAGQAGLFIIERLMVAQSRKAGAA